MTRFLVTYRGAASDEQKASATESPEDRAAFTAAWGRWMERNAAAIVDGGTPVGRTMRVSAAGIAESRNDIVAYTIVEAPSLEAAAAMFADHPHLWLLVGNAIEISECLALPG